VARKPAAKNVTTLGSLKKSVDDLQSQLSSLAQGQSELKEHLHAQGQHPGQSGEASEPDNYTYP
jgi:hypothetical protein